METHFYTMELFFLSLDFPYEYTESFPTIFYYAPVRIFRLMNAQKNLENWELGLWQEISTNELMLLFQYIE